MKTGSLKLLIESYFDLAIAALVNIHAYYFCQNFEELALFFSGNGNLLNSGIHIIYVITLIVVVIYSNAIVVYQFKNIHRQEVFEQLELLSEGGNLKSLNSAMMGIYFLYRRLFTAIVLVCFYQYPSMQNFAMLTISLINLIYILKEKPYLEKRTNQIEAFNEVSILLCNYLT